MRLFLDTQPVIQVSYLEVGFSLSLSRERVDPFTSMKGNTYSTKYGSSTAVCNSSHHNRLLWKLKQTGTSFAGCSETIDMDR